MGIKIRGGSVAFYHSRREGNRVITEYGGSGLLARMKALDAEAARGEKAERLAERRAIDADLATTREVLDQIVEAVGGAIEAAGYRRHNRGEWRRIRGGRTMSEGRTMTDGEFAIIKRTSKGDKSAVNDLHDLMDRFPQIIERFGDLAAKARESVMKGAYGTDLLSRESIGRRMDEIRTELEGAKPTAVERMLAERAAFCWAKLYLAEMTSTGGKAIQFGDYHGRKVDRLHRQYVGSLKALAQVRKLDLTLIQVAAEKAVVVASAPG